MVPRYLVLAVVGFLFFICVFVGPKAPFCGHFGLILKPQGSILRSFGSHVAPLKAQIWGHVVHMFGPFVSVRFAKTYSMFDPFVSVRFAKTFYISLRPQENTMFSSKT